MPVYLSFNGLDNLLLDLPKDINKIIHDYYYDSGCNKCKISCDKCEFCSEYAKKGYFCKCCCCCSILISDNWEDWYENHTGIEIIEEMKEKIE